MTYDNPNDAPTVLKIGLAGTRRTYGDLAPGLVHFTEDHLFGQLWKRPELSARDRSLVTVACLVTNGNAEQLGFHLSLARENGNSESELVESITHLAFYAGWPQAMTALAVAKQVFDSPSDRSQD